MISHDKIEVRRAVVSSDERLSQTLSTFRGEEDLGHWAVRKQHASYEEREGGNGTFEWQESLYTVGTIASDASCSLTLTLGRGSAGSSVQQDDAASFNPSPSHLFALREGRPSISSSVLAFSWVKVFVSLVT